MLGKNTDISSFFGGHSVLLNKKLPIIFYIRALITYDYILLVVLAAATAMVLVPSITIS